MAAGRTLVLKVDLSKWVQVLERYRNAPDAHWIECWAVPLTNADFPDDRHEALYYRLRDGKIDSVKGRAWVVDKKTNAKLKVSFFWPFRGDYWIIDLGKDYEYAVVSAPSMNYLWVLSRTPQMDEQRYQQIVGRLKDRGFDIARLNRTQQGNRKD